MNTPVHRMSSPGDRLSAPDHAGAHGGDAAGYSGDDEDETVHSGADDVHMSDVDVVQDGENGEDGQDGVVGMGGVGGMGGQDGDVVQPKTGLFGFGWEPVLQDAIPVEGASFRGYLTDAKQLGEEDAIIGLEWLEMVWTKRRKEASRTARQLLEWEMGVFGMNWDVDSILLPEDVMDRFRTWQIKVHTVRDALTSDASLDPEENEKGDCDAFERCRDLLSCMYMVMLHVIYMAPVHHPVPAQTPFEDGSEHLDAVLRFQLPVEKMKPKQLVLFKILNYMRINQWRHIGEVVLKQVYAHDRESGIQYPTHTWVRVNTIPHMMAQFMSPHMDPSIANVLTQQLSARTEIQKVLTDWVGREFPVVEKDRHVFSFRNGIYDAMQRKWFPYRGAEQLPSHIVAAKFFDQDFPEQYADREFLRNGGWRRIPLPRYNQILELQFGPVPEYPGADQIDDEVLSEQNKVVLTHFFFQGQLIYWVNELDRFQVAPYYKGFPGTGKSTISAVAQTMYEAEDVSDIANRGEQVFGVSTFYKCFIAANTDVRRDFNLDASFLQKAISGEQVRVAVKNQVGESVIWKTRLLFAGNMFPRFDGECARALSRRLIVFQLDRPVPSGADNPHLQTDITDNEMGAFILKSNEAYRQWLDGEYVPGYGRVPGAARQRLSKYLAEPFMKQASYINQQMNHLEKFIADSGKIEYEPGSRVLLTELAAALQQYIRSIGEREVNVSFRDRDVFLPILRQNRLDWANEEAVHPVTRVMMRSEWILGCRLVGP